MKYLSVVRSGLAVLTLLFFVSGCDSAGTGSTEPGDPALWDTQPPVLSAQTDGDSVTLVWTNVGEASYYEIYRNSTANTGKDTSRATRISSPLSTDKNAYDEVIQPGEIYYYWIRACNNEDGCSDYSDSREAQRISPPQISKKVSGTQVTLDWRGSRDFNYKIYRNTNDSDKSAKHIGDVSLSNSDSKYVFNNTIEANITYYFWVKACKSGSCSVFSEPREATATVPGIPVLEPDRSGDTATLTWGSIDSATYYNIYKQHPDSTSRLHLRKEVGEPQATSYSEDLTRDTYYWVEACNGDSPTSCSRSSNIAVFLIDAPYDIRSLSATRNGLRVTLSWDLTPAGYFEIYRDTTRSFVRGERLVASLAYDEVTLASASKSSYVDVAAAGDTYYYWVKACNNYGCSPPSNFASIEIPASLNDTGVTRAGALNTNSDSCSSDIDASQDCDQGRDATFNHNSDGYAGFSFTRLNADGSKYTGSNVFDAERWYCVKDNVTGLVWEVSTRDTEYRWGGITAIGQTHSHKQGVYVESGTGSWSSLVEEKRNGGLCGYNDWRVPTKNELMSLVDYSAQIQYGTSAYGTTIDITHFPDIKTSSVFWTASPDQSNSENAWAVRFKPDFDASEDIVFSRQRNDDDDLALVRLVRGGIAVYEMSSDHYIVDQWPDSRYQIDTVEDTVVDTLTNLMWKRCMEGKTGNNCLTDEQGVAESYNWQQALERASNSTASGHKDWRLPNIKELASLAALDRSAPGINSNVFPGLSSGTSAASEIFWSSTLYAGYSADNQNRHSLAIDFRDGAEHQKARSEGYKVRLVRDNAQ